MRFPSGYGSIVNLGKGRREPYAVRITTEYITDKNTGKVKQKYKYLAYFADRKDAINYLANYNIGRPVNEHISLTSSPTFKEAFDEWIAYRNSLLNKVSKGSMKNYTITMNLMSELWDRKLINLKHMDLQLVINKYNSKSKSTISVMRTVLKGIYSYAIKNGIVTVDYSNMLDYEWTNTSDTIHTRFTDEEILLLWNNLYMMHNIDAFLICIYTGLRPTELCEIETSNINIKEQYMIGGMKTDAGRNRIIPICDKILPLVKTRLSENRKYLITNKFGNHYSYGVYYDSFIRITNKLNLKHNPHDCRYTFASMMDNVGANTVCLKLIMGHSIDDITKGVYTEKNPSELLAEVQKLNNYL